MITPTHLKKEHDMTIDEYKEKYPDAKLGVSRKNYKKEKTDTETETKETKSIAKNIEDEILNKIKTILPNIEKNVNIVKQKTHLLVYEYTADFADKYKKIIINFPKAIFHNASRNFFERNLNLLKADGWKVLEIYDFKNYIQTIKDFLKGN